MIEQFRAEAEAAGLRPSEIIADGQLRRCPVEGKPGGQDGAYRAYLDEPATIWFQNHRTGAVGKWTAGRTEPMGEAERQKLQERIEADRKAREAEQAAKWAEAAAKAQVILDQAEPCMEHLYLKVKGVKPCAGLKGDGEGNLLVPVLAVDGKPQSLQAIKSDGTKRFLNGGKMGGGFFAIGQDKTGPLLICEGLATGLSIHESTGHTVVVAFNAGNLEAVARLAREKYPDRQVTITGDDDRQTEGNPGRTKAMEAARAVGAKVALPKFSGDQAGSDFNDLHQAEGLEAVKAQVEAALAPPKEPEPSGSNPDIEKATQAETLLHLARDATYFHTPNQDHFANVEIGGHFEVYPVTGNEFRQWLARRFYLETGKGLGTQGMQAALDTIRAWAAFDGPEREVHVRVAAQGDKIYLDLARPRREVVEVTPGGWHITTESSVQFFRPKGMRPLPLPESPGDLTLLGELINLVGDQDRVLTIAWLLGVLHPRGPYPLLLVQGEQGSGKSMACRTLQNILDPCKAPLRTVPETERDLMVMAENRRVLAFDNLSGMRPELSDSLCRLSTGGGLSSRRLYTDRDEIIFEAARPMLLNGIGEIAGRPDLLDRAVKVQLPHIPPEKRVQERVLASRFDQHHAAILGGILTAVSEALKNIEQVKLDHPPRMADFTAWVIAGESALPWETGAFLRAFKNNLAESAEIAMDDDLVAPAIIKFMETRTCWEGRACDLLAELENPALGQITSFRYWPATPAALAKKLARLTPMLRTAGIHIEKSARTQASRGWIIKKVDNLPSLPSLPSHPSQSQTKPIVSHGRNVSPHDTHGTNVSRDKHMNILNNDTCDTYDNKFGGNPFPREVQL